MTLQDVTVLLVEDEAQFASVIRRVLEREGFEVLLAGDAERALELFDRPAADISLVISDVNLPGMDGIRMMCLMLQVRPKTGFLLMSGYCADSILESYGSFGNGTEFISKPFSIESFIEKVRAVLLQ